MKVEGFDMMNLHFATPVATGGAGGLALQVFSGHSVPLRTAFVSMLSGNARTMIYFPFDGAADTAPPSGWWIACSPLATPSGAL
jgi:hypothetical protein